MTTRPPVERGDTPSRFGLRRRPAGRHRKPAPPLLAGLPLPSAAATTAAVLAGATVAALGVVATPADAAARRWVSGWIPWWSTSQSSSALVAAGAAAAEGSPFWFRTNGRTIARISTDATAGQFADTANRLRRVGAKVVPTVVDSLDTAAPGTAAQEVAAALLDPRSRQAHADSLAALVARNGWDGIDLDYEAIYFRLDRATRVQLTPAFSDFTRRLAAALHSRGKILSITVPAPFTTCDNRYGSTAPFDYRAIGASADRVRIMAYDHTVGAPGPVAPLCWVEDVVEYAVARIAPAKVRLGIPSYGREWTLSSTGRVADMRNLTWATADTLRRVSGATRVWEPRAAEYRFTYRGRDGRTRVVRYGDAASFKARQRIAERYRIDGIALWEPGSADPAVWAAARASAVASAPRAARLTLTTGATASDAGAVVATLTGADGARLADQRVVFQARSTTPSRGAWRSVGVAITGTDGRAGVTHAATGTWEYRAVYGGSFDWNPTTSATARRASWTTLAAGTKGPGVSAVQRALTRAGLATPVTGTFGTTTTANVTRFQRAKGLPATGVVDLTTARALGVAPAPSTVPAPGRLGAVTRILEVGDEGPDVVLVQRALTRAGYVLPADGFYGRLTRATVARFQLAAGLDADGVVGPMTTRALGLG